MPYVTRNRMFWAFRKVFILMQYLNIMHRPIGVYIIAIILLISSFITFILMSMFLISFVITSINFSFYLMIFTILTFLLSIFTFIVSIGILRFKKWSYHSIIYLNIFELFFAPINLIIQIFQYKIDITQLVSLGGSIIFSIIILQYFSRKEIKKQFY
jgi:hypothetical protein